MVGLWGATETQRRMNKVAPGHGLSQRQINELDLQCVICATNKQKKEDTLIPIVRSIKLPHSCCAIGIDAVEITPYGKFGQSHIYEALSILYKTDCSFCRYNLLGILVVTFRIVDHVWTHRHGYCLCSDLNSNLFADQ